MNTACQWQYNPTAVARQEAMNNPYTWACYSGSLSVTPTPTLSPTPSPSVTPTPASGSATYLALGDSFAFGFHLAQYQQEIANHTYNPASFNDGYDAVLLKDLQGVNANMQEVNYACPGETSGSFVNGGCAFHSSNQLHNAYPNSQSQLQAAVTYLQAHPGQQTVITLDLGVNDAIALSDICQAQANPIACYNQRTPGVLATVKQNYDIILNALQKVAAQARIILIKAPTPVYYDGTDQLNNGINKIIDDEAFSRGLRNADTASIFTANNICSITNYCANPSDFHPNAQGYSMMANQIWNASGYAKN